MHSRMYSWWHRHPLAGPTYNPRPCNSESLYEDNELFWPWTSPPGIGKTSAAVQRSWGTWEKFFTGCMNGSWWSSIDSALRRQIQLSAACVDEAKVWAMWTMKLSLHPTEKGGRRQSITLHTHFSSFLNRYLKSPKSWLSHWDWLSDLIFGVGHCQSEGQCGSSREHCRVLSTSLPTDDLALFFPSPE